MKKLLLTWVCTHMFKEELFSQTTLFFHQQLHLFQQMFPPRPPPRRKKYPLPAIKTNAEASIFHFKTNELWQSLKEEH